MASSTQILSLVAGQENVSLDGVSYGIAAGDKGNVFRNAPGAENLAVQVDIIGAPTVISVTILGSLDGIYFYKVATYSAVTGALYFIVNSPANFWQAVLSSFTGPSGSGVKVSFGVQEE